MNDSFYLTGEMAVFQVENQLFRVPQCLLSHHSPFFYSMFSLPCGDGKVVEGRSEVDPIPLPGVKVLEFEILLLYLFNGANDTFCLPQSSWVALLSIAHRYEFMNVRERAIREIYDRKPDSDPKSKPDYAMLISAAEKYDVPPWHVVPTFVAVVVREEPLTDVEAALLPMGTVVRLARAREEFLRKIIPMRARDALFSTPSDEAGMARRIVSNIWQIAKVASKRNLDA